MNVSTYSFPALRLEHGFSSLLRIAGAVLRRSFELAGAPYVEGARPL